MPGKKIGLDIPINFVVNLELKNVDEAIKKILVLRERMAEIGEVKEDLGLLLSAEIKKNTTKAIKSVLKNDKKVKEIIGQHFNKKK